MKVGIVAWGSLIWDSQDLAIAKGFEPIGPRLPIEFCRISNDGRLTLVIDEAIGEKCTTYVAESAFDDLDLAIGNLWVREGAHGEKLPDDIRKHGRIGFIDLTGDQRHSLKAIQRHPSSVEEIDHWAKEKGYDAMIWTALGVNFHQPEKAACPFSVAAAVQYLQALASPAFDRALTYIRRAPAEVQTPVRVSVNMRWPEG